MNTLKALSLMIITLSNITFASQCSFYEFNKSEVSVSNFSDHFDTSGRYTFEEKEDSILKFQVSKVYDTNWVDIFIKTNDSYFGSSFWCIKEAAKYRCMGDDDGGHFEIEYGKKVKLSISHIRFGEPDGVSIKVTHKIKGRDIQVSGAEKDCEITEVDVFGDEDLEDEEEI